MAESCLLVSHKNGLTSIARNAILAFLLKHGAVICFEPRLYSYCKLLSMNTAKLLRLPDVKAVTGLSKSTIYSKIADGTFPKQISLGPRIVVWLESDIQKWICTQVAGARA